MPPPGFATAPNPFLGTREGLILGVCNISLQRLLEPLHSISQSLVSQAVIITIWEHLQEQHN